MPFKKSFDPRRVKRPANANMSKGSRGRSTERGFKRTKNLVKAILLRRLSGANHITIHEGWDRDRIPFALTSPISGGCVSQSVAPSAVIGV